MKKIRIFLPTSCIYAFRVVFTVNSSYYTKRNEPAGVSCGDVTFSPASYEMYSCILFSKILVF
jgi:hypothetical protein